MDWICLSQAFFAGAWRLLGIVALVVGGVLGLIEVMSWLIDQLPRNVRYYLIDKDYVGALTTVAFGFFALVAIGMCFLIGLNYVNCPV